MVEPKATVAAKGELVQVHIVVLEPEARADNLPPVTRRHPYEGWVKGYLLGDRAEVGDAVRIETLIGRQVEGILAEVNPRYDHDFGEPQPELNRVGPEAWRRLQARGEEP